jgi:hypothetical protein
MPKDALDALSEKRLIERKGQRTFRAGDFTAHRLLN